MFSPGEVPFLRLSLPFLAGIIFSRYVDVSLPVLIVSIFVLFFFYSIQVSVRKLISYSTRWVPGILIHLFLFFSGWILAYASKEINHPHHFSKRIDSNSLYLAEIKQEPEKRKNSIRFIAEINQVFHREKSIPVRGKVMVYSSPGSSFQYGDEILFSASPQPLKGPMNPDEFDYRAYLANKNVYHSVFINTKQITIVNSVKSITAYSIQLRNYLLTILGRHLTGDELAVASALLLGYENSLDNDLLTSYSEAGVIHVLSVSGFHVMIIFLVFNFILGFFNRLKFGKYIKIILLLVLIWSYAMITGLSAPVVRASVMISFLITGKILREDSHSLNILALSAFLMLLYDPYMLFDIGFQLSFLAVAGIITLYPLMYNLYIPRYYLSDKIWGMICVSMAAQIATLPLSVYYFHKIPVYFLLANLVIVPASTLLIYAGMALLIFSGWGLAANLLGFFLSGITWMLNGFVSTIAEFPGSVIGSITVNEIQCLMLYLFIILFVYWLLMNAQRSLVAALCILFAVLVSEATETYSLLHRKKIIVHCLQGESILQLVDGDTSYLITSSGMPAESSLNWSVKPFQENNGIRMVALLNPDSIHDFKTSNLMLHGNTIYFFDKRILLAKNAEDIAAGDAVYYDLVTISAGSSVDFTILNKKIHSGRIILDSSIKGIKLSYFKETAQANGIACYPAAENGAYVLDF